ncbi:glycosyltransferase family 9 protein [Pseudoroseomonas cervicalis]|uniref:glycosyltransferase family 9 protein n=1 Tax=Teichococcus cervicalis TaxID=204525 RepID=UPI00277F454A|nr:glycosyltransferase family 9 protein [Pseudoroseomonas cervicalis]MDQ1079565.1 ADP-heptose:LPS heptosyltransferase/glycosyltransferase involved in cell wall biosynthesis [Pseudoroseomonas cervicalis]
MQDGKHPWLQAEVDWLALPDPAPAPAVLEAMARLNTVPDRAALVEITPGPDAAPQRFWRRDYLRQLVEYGLVDSGAGLPALLSAAAHMPRRHRHSLAPAGPWSAPEAAPPKGTVLLVSTFGIQKFGGAEHFLEQIARLYRALGHDPLIVGTRAERVGEGGLTPEGLRYTFIAQTPAALFRLAFEERAVIAHVVSGLGHEVSAALRFLDTRLVFGIHFWRELLLPSTANPGYYPGGPEAHAPRPDFALLLADCDALYANSEFTRQVVEESFGARLPVIPSLPDDLAAPPRPTEEGRDVVLLANSRFDKGYHFVLEVARHLPDIPFVVTATQSGIEVAEAARIRAGARNVTLRPRCDDMAELYAGARAVLVPSYQFVETFSRVVVEAQRFGVPVIGSDQGNVPFLLRQSGVSLPERPDLWAAEIRRLWDDRAYWAQRSGDALRHAEANGFHQQQGRLQRLLQGLEAPFLLGVGSGIGNIIHTTPLIRRLARHLGQRIDVVVAGDSAAALAVVANSEFVGQVFSLGDAVVRRHYDTVFLTHSFGTLQPPFRARRVIRSRSWDSFHAGHRYHEAEFNLAAATALLGIPYAPDDVTAAFMGDLRRTRCETDLIGFHAGSKTGAWAAKRWPHFAELAAALQGEGWRVASFGSPDEHVPGTLDMTGGSVEEMAARMSACRAFVSNDSGGMNIANALGIPLLAIFGPTEPRTRAPLGPFSRVVALRKPCAPCELAGHGGPFFRGLCGCIADIAPETVQRALAKLLQETEEAALATRDLAAAE